MDQLLIASLDDEILEDLLWIYCHYPGDVVRDLDLSHHASGVHPGSLVDGVAPDIEDRLAGPDHPTHEGSTTDAHSQIEVVERVNVDVLETMAHSDRIIHQFAQVFHVIAAIILAIYLNFNSLQTRVLSLRKLNSLTSDSILEFISYFNKNLAKEMILIDI